MYQLRILTQLYSLCVFPTHVKLCSYFLICSFTVVEGGNFTQVLLDLRPPVYVYTLLSLHLRNYFEIFSLPLPVILTRKAISPTPLPPPTSFILPAVKDKERDFWHLFRSSNCFSAYTRTILEFYVSPKENKVLVKTQKLPYLILTENILKPTSRKMFNMA